MKGSLCAASQAIGQQRFRTELFEAYTGRCAVSGCNVDEALEAAHIENYSGPKSQVVSNGLFCCGAICTRSLMPI